MPAHCHPSVWLSEAGNSVFLFLPFLLVDFDVEFGSLKRVMPIPSGAVILMLV